MEEDDTATDMDKDDKDDQNEDEEVMHSCRGGGARRMGEAYKGCKYCLGGGYYNLYKIEAWQEQLIFLQNEHLVEKK